MSSAEKFQVISLFLEVLIFFFVVRMLALYQAESADLPDLEESKPDLMEQALTNIALTKMQKELRELMAYGEPDDLKALVAEYMRLKEAKEVRELIARNENN